MSRVRRPRRGTYRKPATRRGRLVRLLLALTIAVAGITVATAPSARADCTSSVLDSLGLGGLKSATPPSPVWPNSGIPGWFASTPDMKNVPDTAPDPFANPKVPIQSVYGNQWGWSTFDQGCIPDPINAADTKLASFTMGWAGGWTQLLQSVEDLATKGNLGWLQHVVVTVATSLQPMILGSDSSVGWLSLALVVVAIMVAFSAGTADYAEVAKRFGVVVAAIAIVVLSLVYPAELAGKLDKAVTATSTIGFSSTGQGNTASALIGRQADYQGWLAGMFADPKGDTATKYGPTLYAATHYSWSDVKAIQADQNAQKGIDKTKADAFTKAAKEIKSSDPASYSMLQGNEDRSGPAQMAAMSGALMSAFVFSALLVVCVARVMMAGLVIAAAFMALSGMIRGKNGPGLTSIWDMLSAAVIETAKQSVGAAVMTVVLGAIYTANLSGGAIIFWEVIVTIVGFAILKPFSAVKRMVPGLDPHRSYVGGLLGKAGKAGITAVAAGFGAERGVKIAEKAGQEETREEKTQVAITTAKTRPMPALETAQEEVAPVWTVRQVFDDEASRPTSRAWAGVVPSSASTSYQQLPAATSPNTLAASPQSLVIEGRTVHELPAGSTPTTSQQDSGSDAVSGPVISGPVVITSAGGATTGSTTGTSTTSEDATSTPTTTSRPNGEPLYVPRTTPLYVAGTSGDVIEVVPVHEPEIDQDGHEHQEVVLYQSPREEAQA